MAGYLGASPVPQTIQKKQSFTATASQTTFTTTGYTDGAFINVYLNGVRLINGTDYTATNGSDIVLTTGASASDVLDFETFNEFTLVDQTLETPTFRTSATLKNDTEEDTDGGRESTLIFKGEQSGGEISTLAEIEASHDGTADDEKGDLIFRTNDGSDGTSPTERARIDSSGNFLVATTDNTPYDNNANDGTDQGLTLSNTGRMYAATNGNPLVILNRTASDGEIAQFRRSGTSVGALSAKAYDMAIHSTASGHKGIRLHSVGILPTDNSGNLEDNTSDIGSTTYRFNDLFLGGGAYIGGTVAANKLDDYEEGTWTPVLGGSTSTSGQSYTIQSGVYTKVGNHVTATAYVAISSIGTISGTYAYIMGLPFNVANNTGAYAAVNFGYHSGFGQNHNSLHGYTNINTSFAYITYQNGANLASAYLSPAGLGSSPVAIFSVTYMTDA